MAMNSVDDLRKALKEKNKYQTTDDLRRGLAEKAERQVAASSTPTSTQAPTTQAPKAPTFLSKVQDNAAQGRLTLPSSSKLASSPIGMDRATWQASPGGLKVKGETLTSSIDQAKKDLLAEQAKKPQGAGYEYYNPAEYAAERKVKELTAKQGDLAAQYYQADSASKLDALKKQPGDYTRYADAKTKRADMEKLARAQEEAVAADYLYLQGKYGVEPGDKDGYYNLLTRLQRELDGEVKALGTRGVDFDRLTRYEDKLAGDAFQAQAAKEFGQFATKNPALSVLASGASVLASPFQGLDAIPNLLRYAGKSDPSKLDSYEPMSTADFPISNYVSTTRGAVAGNIEDNTRLKIGRQNVASFLYQTGMSIGDSALQVGTVGPAAALFMGASAATNQARDIVDRGGSNQQAFWGGLAAGAAETIFEKVSIESLLKVKDVTGWKRLLTETAKQAGVEASEEIFTEIANILSDAAIMGDKSEFETSVRNYMADGTSRADATGKAFLDSVAQVAWAGAGGALSGGVMGGGVNLNNYRGNAKTGVALRNMGTDVPGAIVDEGLLSAQGTDSREQAEAVAKRQAAGKTIPDAALGGLYRANVEAVNAEAVNADADTQEARTSPAATQTGATMPEGTAGLSSGAVDAQNAARAAMLTAQVREGKAIGDNGKAAFSAAYDGSADVVPFYGEFMQYYNAGVNGQKLGAVSSKYGETLTHGQRFVAWKAGGDDAAASLTAEQKKAKLVTVYSEGGGLVRNETAGALETATADLVDRMGKALGVKVVVDASISSPDGKASGANGYYSNGVVHLSADSANPAMVVVKHEMTHRMQELSPVSYRAFRDYAMRLTQDSTQEVERLKYEYAKAGQTLSNEEAMDEIAANLTERLMTDRESVDRFIREDRSAAQKFFDTLKKLVQTLKEKLGRAEPTLEQAERLWKDAFKAAEREAGKGQKNTAQEGGGTKHSLDPDFAAQFDQWMAGTTPSQRRASPGYFQIGTTSEALKSIGMDDYRIFFGKSKLEKIMEKHPAMNAEVMKSIPDVLEHPILVMQSQTVVNRVTLFGEAMDADGKPVLVALELSPQNKRGEVLDFAVIASAYGKDNAQNLIDSSHILYVEPNKNRTDSWLRLLGLQLPSRVTSYGSIDSISFVKRDVNGNLSFGEAGGNTAMREAFEQAEKRSLATTPGGASPGPQTSETLSGTAPTHSIPTDEGKGNTKFSLKVDSEGRELTEARAARLEELNEYLRGQLKLTKVPVTDKRAVEKLAKSIIKDYSPAQDQPELSGRLQALYDMMASPGVTWDGVHNGAIAIAGGILSSSLVRNDEDYRQYASLRKYAKDTKLHVPKHLWADLGSNGGYSEFKKANRKWLSLSSTEGLPIDVAYKELSEMYPEFFDEYEHSNQADQLVHLAEVLAGLQPIMENPHRAHMEEATAYLAADIIERFYDTPQQKPTFADNEETKRVKQKISDTKKLDLLRDRKNAQIDDLRQKKNDRIKAIQADGKKAVETAILEERADRDEKLQALKDKFKSKEAAGRDRRSANELRRKISKHAKELSQRLLRPSDKKHIPEAMRGPVAAMLEAINMESAYTVDSETGKKSKEADGLPTKRTEAFRALKKQYAEIVARGGDMVVDPSLLGSDAEGIEGSFDLVIGMQNTKLADMTLEQLEIVWKVVRAVEHSVNTAGKMLSKAKFARTQDWARALVSDTGSRRNKKGNISLDLETPYTFFSHYGDSGKAVFRMLRDAQDQRQVMEERVKDAVVKVVDPKTVEKLEKETHSFTTERGEELTISTAQVMELYELMKRKQAHDHILKGGIVQPRVDSKKIRRGTDSILLTGEDVGRIVKVLTDEQIDIADALQSMTTGMLADYGNEASMAAYGYKKFVSEDYWPIKSAKEAIHSSVEKGGNQPRSIKNIGMAQAIMPHASTSLDLPGLFTTFSTHTAEMLDYAAWLLPMEDASRLFNYQFKDDEGQRTGKTVKGLLERVGGEGAQRYWRNLMDDVQNGINSQSDSAFSSVVSKSVRAFKGAAVGGNLRVVVQQPTAFFRAGVVLNPQDLSRGLVGGATKGDGWKKAVKYSPIAKRKSAGGFDISNPYQMKEILFDGRSTVRKINDKLAWGAGAADAVTWGRLWNACEWATARDHKDLAKGSEEFYAATNTLFTETIDQTQVVDGVLQRSNIMRSSNEVIKQATSFMGEPIMSLNLMMRSYDRVRYESDPARRSKAIKAMGRAGTALIVTGVVNALAQSIVDGLRDDDEDKKYWERFQAAFTGLEGDEESAWDKAVAVVLNGNLVDGMNPIGQIPFLRDALSLLKGYDVARTDMEIVSDVISAGALAVKSADGTGKRTRSYAVKELVAAGAKFFALPVGNVYRDMWGIVRSIAVETDNIPLQFEMEKAVYNITNDGNKGRYYDILFRALEQGDTDSYQHISAEMMEKMGVKEEDIKTAMAGRRKKTEEFTTASSTVQAGIVSALEGNSGYASLTDEQKEKAIEAAKDYANVATLQEQDSEYVVPNTYSWVEKAQGGASVGIEPWEYILFNLAYSMAESEKGADGKTVPGSKQENVVEALDRMNWLTRRERDYLYGTRYSSDKNNPYK